MCVYTYLIVLICVLVFAFARSFGVDAELLGSFGDNELSPECLDGAQRFLKPDTGISVPQSYSSFIAPISSSKLHQEVKAYNDVKHFETTYVVKMHQHKVCVFACAVACVCACLSSRCMCKKCEWRSALEGG